MQNLRLLFIILFLPFSGTAHIRESYCKISVYDKQAPLEYVYIFINGKYFAGTDSLGTVNIPRKLLKLGDTLSVSYVGMHPGTFIYRGESGHIFNLTPSITLSEVNKTADIGKFFAFYKKNVKVMLPFATSYKFRYTAEQCHISRLYISQSGYMELSKIYYRGNYTLDYQLNKLRVTTGDSSGLKSAVTCLSDAYHILHLLRYSDIAHARKYSLKYLGETGLYNVFVWNYISPADIPPQLIIYANKETKLVDKIESAYIHIVTGKLVRRLYSFEHNKKRGTYLTEGKIYAYSGSTLNDNYTLISLDKED